MCAILSFVLNILHPPTFFLTHSQPFLLNLPTFLTLPPDLSYSSSQHFLLLLPTFLIPPPNLSHSDSPIFTPFFIPFHSLSILFTPPPKLFHFPAHPFLPFFTIFHFPILLSLLLHLPNRSCPCLPSILSSYFSICLSSFLRPPPSPSNSAFSPSVA
jgi:hypothetical protein